MAGELALREPEVTVGIEDATAEEVAEDVDEGLALGVVAEVGLEYVLHIVRVGGDDGAAGAEAAHDEGLRRGGREEVGVPVEEAVPVAVEGDEAANERVGVGTIDGVSRSSNSSSYYCYSREETKHNIMKRC